MGEIKVLNTIFDIISHYDATAGGPMSTLEQIRECVILGIQDDKGPSVESRLEILEANQCAVARLIGTYSGNREISEGLIEKRLDHLEKDRDKADLTTKVHKARLSIHSDIMNNLHTLIKQSFEYIMDHVDQLEADKADPSCEIINAIPDDAPPCFSCGEGNCDDCGDHGDCDGVLCTKCDYTVACDLWNDSVNN